MKRGFIVLSAILLAVLGCFSLPAAQRPNIVVIMADDLDVDTLDYVLGLYPQQEDLLPDIRQSFVDEGIHFPNFFVTAPVCCPSRASFLTGRYVHRHGVKTNTPDNPPPSRGCCSPPGSIQAFGDPTDTLPNWLAAEPLLYTTVHIGKYLNFYGTQYKPTLDSPPDPIFDAFLPQGWSRWRGLKDFSTYRYYDYSYRHELDPAGTLRFVDGNEAAFLPENELHQTEVLVRTSHNTDPNAAMAEGIPALLAGTNPVFLAVFPLLPIPRRGLSAMRRIKRIRITPTPGMMICGRRIVLKTPAPMPCSRH